MSRNDVAGWVDLVRARFRSGDIAGFEQAAQGLLQYACTDKSPRARAFVSRPWAETFEHAPWPGYARCCFALACFFFEPDGDEYRLIDGLASELAGALAGRPSAPYEIVEPAIAWLAERHRAAALVYIDAVERVQTGQEAALEFCRAAVAWPDDQATVRALERSVAADPMSANTWYGLAGALFLRRGGAYSDAPANAADGAREAYERALALYESKDQRPVDACVRAVGHVALNAAWDRQKAMRERTTLLIHFERWEPALASARELVAVAPESWRAHDDVGYVLWRLGRDLEADAVYTEAIARLPATMGDDRADGVWLGRARARVRLGREREALDDLARAIDIGPVIATYVSDLPQFTDPALRVELEGYVRSGQERAAREAQETRRREHDELRAKIADWGAGDLSDSVRQILLDGLDSLSPGATTADAARALEAIMAGLRHLVSADPRARAEIADFDVDLHLNALARLYDVKGFSADLV